MKNKKISILAILAVVALLSLSMVYAKIDKAPQSMSIDPEPESDIYVTSIANPTNYHLATFASRDAGIITNSNVMSDGVKLWTTIGGSRLEVPDALISTISMYGIYGQKMFSMDNIEKGISWYIDNNANMYTDGDVYANELIIDDAYVSGNLEVTGNLVVEGCIQFNGGVLGTCV